MNIISILQSVALKDWFIFVSLFVLVLCVLQIRKLKKSIVQEIHKRIIPQLTLKLNVDSDVEEAGLFLQNDSFFLARDIKIKDINLTLDDFGIKQNFILRFEGMDFLRPKEKSRLKLKVLDNQGVFSEYITERIMPHLVIPSFKVEITYSNVEGLGLSATFLKKENNFYIKDTQVQ